MKPKRLPDAEFEIMEYIWDSVPPVTTAMVMERIGHARGWKIQTVVSLFGRLTERGFLRAEKSAKRERDFYPIISRDEYLRLETENFLDRYHKKSVASLLAALHGEKLTKDDVDELSAWVKEIRKETEERSQ